MFKKKKQEPVEVASSEAQVLDVTSKEKQKEEAPGREVTLEDQVIAMTEVEYRTLLLNILLELTERVKVIENEAIQSRNQ